MLLGSMLAGQAFANAPVAAVHALAYPLGGHFGMPHGLSNALVLPQVMRFNAPACGALYANSPAACSRIWRTSTTRSRFIDALDALSIARSARPAPARCRRAREALDLLADDAMKQTRLLVNNPRPLTGTDALRHLRAAW
jgi:alcohol dehydrogenase class IV